MNDFKFGDKLKLSNGEMAVYAGWNYETKMINDGDSPWIVPGKDRLHYIFMRHKTSFCIADVYDDGRLHGSIYVVGRW